jgi:signal transduction histidine kinase
MSIHAAPHTVTLRNVVLLTILSVLFLSATVTLGFLYLPAGVFPDMPRPAGPDEGLGLVRSIALLACPLGYAWICLRLTDTPKKRLVSLRYALVLQLQALGELSVLAAMAVPAIAFIDLPVQPGHATGFGGYWHYLTASETMRIVLYLTLLSMPALSMMMTVWRLHALSRTPGMLGAAVEGRLCRAAAPVSGDAALVRAELVRHLERLTGAATPGLGRVWYGSHPKMTSRDTGDEVEHALVWFTCPMQLLVSAHAVAGGGQEVHVRCVLRPGPYRLYLAPTPLDAAAQMGYIEAHLLQPLAAQLARLGAERQRDALRAHALATQLRILQAQIEPHFLFNTLANVRQLYRGSLAGGEAMMDHLIAYLRCAMDDLRAEHSDIVREMDLVMHYLSIMQVRMGERLAYQFSVPESLLHHPFPPAMLISLVENAIKHGLAERDHGQIALTAVREGDLLRVSVSDDGAGFSSVGGTGVGLSNIRQRLEAMYGSRAWLEVGAPAAGGFCATIVIPCEERIS